MTITTAGFTGTTDAPAWGKLSAELGNQFGTVNSKLGFVVSINAAGTRTVDISAGTATAGGVQATSDATASLALDIVSLAGATRWDAVVLRRDWSASSVTIVKVNGVAALAAPQIIPTGLNNSPGVLLDQVLSLVQVTNGATLPTSVVDMRFWGSKVLTARTLGALPTATAAMFGTEVVLFDNTRVRCVQDVSNNFLWQTLGGSVTDLTGTTVHAVSTGWAVTTAGGAALTTHAVLGDQFVDLDLCFRRTGALIAAGSDGNFSDTPVCTLKPALFPQQVKDVAIAYCTGTGYGWRQGLAEIGTGGIISLLTGTPNADLPVGGNPDGISLRVSVSYARKVA